MKLIHGSLILLSAVVGLPGTCLSQTIGQPAKLYATDQSVTLLTDLAQPLSKSAVARLAPSTAIPTGGFVVTFARAVPGGNGIFVRRFAADGTALDAGGLAVDSGSSSQLPVVVGRPDGSFIVSWMSDGQDGDDWGIFVRRFAADGTALDAAAIPVNVTTSGSQLFPAAAARSDGSFVVTWQSHGQDGSAWGIFARRFAADGTPLDPADIPVNVNTTGDQVSPAAAARSDGSFVVTWVSNGQDGSGNGVFARRFAADGTALDVADLPVNVTTASEQESPSIVARPDDSFVVTWASFGQDGSDWGVFARRFASSGTPLDATDIPVNVTTTNEQSSPAAAVRPDGSLVITWRSFGQDGSNFGVFARRFASDGTPIDASDLAVNATTSQAQQNPSIVALSDGDTMAIVWEGQGPDDPDGGIYFNGLRVAGAPVARDDTASATQPGSPVVINVLANDADPDVGDTLTVTLASATHGSVAINGDGTLTYTPPAGCGVASDTVSYTIQDGNGNTATASVAVTISPGAAMSVAPATFGKLYGPVGGPFPAPYATYLVSNTGCASMNWRVGRSQTWLARTPASGVIDAGSSTLVTLRAGPDANALPAGTHNVIARFRNLTNGIGNANRTVQLTAMTGFGHNALLNAPTLDGATGVAWGSNIGATGQPGEPDHAGASLPLNSIWWKWTAPATGQVVFNTRGSSFDTTLAAYTGTTVTTLTPVAANDNHGPIAPQSRVSFTAVAGTTYRIAVDGKGAETGQIKLNWEMP